MPTYEYKCSACKHGFEVFQSIKDAAKRKCPKCGKSALERVIGPGGAVIFKGSGFYQTDYRSESYKKAVEADKPKTEGASESKPTEAKAESKPEKKTEPKAETRAAEPKGKAKEKKSKTGA
jgi:putative FmdB family regulatory protein